MLRNYFKYNCIPVIIELLFVGSCFIVPRDYYVMIDEVQMCTGFEKAINGFHVAEKYDIYITGSNAFLLSGNVVSERDRLCGGQAKRETLYSGIREHFG